MMKKPLIQLTISTILLIRITGASLKRISRKLAKENTQRDGTYSYYDADTNTYYNENYNSQYMSIDTYFSDSYQTIYYDTSVGPSKYTTERGTTSY